jgi:three-Cys-motif partner protein
VADCAKKNGNCTKPSDDGLAVQCVGAWAKEKHDFLRRYIDATREVRRKYVEDGAPGGAGFIDLFAGPGRARLRDTGEFIDGSPLVALRPQDAPFTKAILCDLEPESTAALRSRTAPFGSRAFIVDGDCNEKIGDICAAVPPYGLNLALIDPFGVSALEFGTIKRLASFARMDLLLHFPTNTIKRNLHDAKFHDLVDRFFGTTSWRGRINGASDVVQLIEILREQLLPLGYTDVKLNAMPIKNDMNNVLYHLVFASKHDKGDKIWQSITKTDGKGQRSLF